MNIRHLIESRSYGTTSSAAGHAIYLCKTPLLYAVIDDVMDLLCIVTGHRFCNSWVMHWTFKLVDKRTDRFVLPPLDDSVVVQLHAWMSWDPPYWPDDEDT